MNRRILANGRRWCRVALAVAVAPVAGAQTVHNANDVASSSTMLMRNGQYSGCGLRFLAIDLAEKQTTFPVLMWDFNLSLMRSGANMSFMLKAEVSRISTEAQLKSGIAPLLKVATTWIQAEGRDRWTPFKTGIPGENGFSSMTGYTAPDMVNYMADVAEGKGEPLLFGVQLANEKAYRLWRFQPKVNKQDGAAFMACTKALLDQAGRDVQQPRANERGK